MKFRAKNKTLIPADFQAERAMEKTHGEVEVRIITKAERRTLDQNALQWKWYAEIGEFIGEDSGYVHRYCKAFFGIPILRREYPEFRDKYDRLIKGRSYEEKLELMEWIPATSVLTRAQASEYMDSVERYWRQQGVDLTVTE